LNIPDAALCVVPAGFSLCETRIAYGFALRTSVL
jgi:hypothetical protein